MEEESFKVKGKETEKLHQLYTKLEQEWRAIKESSSSSSKVKTFIHQQRETSPPPEEEEDRVMFNLQRETTDVAAQEILEDRREAIVRGRLKGRRLFQSPDRREVRTTSTLFNCSSEDDEIEIELEYENESCSSSSSNCVFGDSIDEDQKVVEEIRVGSVISTRSGNGISRYSVFFGWVAVALFMVAMCMNLVKSSESHDNYDGILVPT